MSIAAVRLLSLYTVAWIHMDSDLRALIRSVKFVDQMFKQNELRLEAFEAEMTAKYENDEDLLLELAVSLHVDPVLDVIQMKADDADSGGRDAHRCYTKAVAASVDISKREFAKIVPCLNRFHDEFQKIFEAVTDHTKLTKTTRSSVNNIIRECRGRDDVKECIRPKVTEANSFAEQQKSVMNAFETKVRKNYQKIYDDATNCITTSGKALDKAMSSLSVSATSCMSTKRQISNTATSKRKSSASAN